MIGRKAPSWLPSWGLRFQLTWKTFWSSLQILGFPRIPASAPSWTFSLSVWSAAPLMPFRSSQTLPTLRQPSSRQCERQLSWRSSCPAWLPAPTSMKTTRQRLSCGSGAATPWMFSTCAYSILNLRDPSAYLFWTLLSGVYKTVIKACSVDLYAQYPLNLTDA